MIWSSLDYVNILAESNASTAGTSNEDQSVSGSFEVVLNYVEFTRLIGHANTSGSATCVIPIAQAICLFSSGLIELIGVARRKKA